MQLTRGGEYGLRGVLYLAQQDAGQISMVSAIADAEDIPPRFLAKIFQALARAGVVKSRRGAKGGFSLRRPASDITVKDVIEAIDGPMRLHRDTASPLRDILEEAQARMVHVLSQANFADLASTKPGTTATGIASAIHPHRGDPGRAHSPAIAAGVRTQ